MAPTDALPVASFKVVDNAEEHLKVNGVSELWPRAYGFNDGQDWERPEHYVRHVGVSEAELATTVEYDMDDVDAAWLDLLNKERAARELGSIPAEVLEIVLDRLEKEHAALRHAQPQPHARGGEAEQDAQCAVCEDSEGSNSNAIVFCDGCDLAVHQDCYGVPYIPEGQWLCRPCALAPGQAVACVLCPSAGGALKQDVRGQWVHLLCALWVPETGVANEALMEPVAGIDAIPKQRWRLRCALCSVHDGACIQCNNRNCYKAFHVTCARNHRLLMPMKATVPGQDPPQLQAFCDVHLPPELIQPRLDALALAPAPDPALPKPTRRAPPKPPLVPLLVLRRIERYIERVKQVRKPAEFVLDVAKFWTLKREARRGAPLLARLSAESGARPPDAQRLAHTRALRKQLEALGGLAGAVLQREKLKADAARAQRDALGALFFPHSDALYAALAAARKVDTYGAFEKPVPRETPGYYAAIARPLCWSAIEARVDGGAYADVQAFADDVRLVLANAKEFNPAAHTLHKLAIRVGNRIEPVLLGLEAQKTSAPSEIAPLHDAEADEGAPMDVDGAEQPRAAEEEGVTGAGPVPSGAGAEEAAGAGAEGAGEAAGTGLGAEETRMEVDGGTGPAPAEGAAPPGGPASAEGVAPVEGAAPAEGAAAGSEEAEPAPAPAPVEEAEARPEDAAARMDVDGEGEGAGEAAEKAADDAAPAGAPTAPAAPTSEAAAQDPTPELPRDPQHLIGDLEPPLALLSLLRSGAVAAESTLVVRGTPLDALFAFEMPVEVPRAPTPPPEPTTAKGKGRGKGWRAKGKNGHVLSGAAAERAMAKRARAQGQEQEQEPGPQDEAEPARVSPPPAAPADSTPAPAPEAAPATPAPEAGPATPALEAGPAPAPPPVPATPARAPRAPRAPRQTLLPGEGTNVVVEDVTAHDSFLSFDKGWILPEGSSRRGTRKPPPPPVAGTKRKRGGAAASAAASEAGPSGSGTTEPAPPAVRASEASGAGASEPPTAGTSEPPAAATSDAGGARSDAASRATAETMPTPRLHPIGERAADSWREDQHTPPDTGTGTPSGPSGESARASADARPPGSGWEMVEGRWSHPNAGASGAGPSGGADAAGKAAKMEDLEAGIARAAADAAGGVVVLGDSDEDDTPLMRTTGGGSTTPRRTRVRSASEETVQPASASAAGGRGRRRGAAKGGAVENAVVESGAVEESQEQGVRGGRGRGAKSGRGARGGKAVKSGDRAASAAGGAASDQSLSDVTELEDEEEDQVNHEVVNPEVVNPEVVDPKVVDCSRDDLEGTFVWAKYATYPYFPARIISIDNAVVPSVAKKQYRGRCSDEKNTRMQLVCFFEKNPTWQAVAPDKLRHMFLSQEFDDEMLKQKGRGFKDILPSYERAKLVRDSGRLL